MKRPSSSGPASSSRPPRPRPRKRKRGKRPPDAPELIPLDGENAKLDAMASVINDVAAPFMTLPPPHQGAVGYAAQALNGVLGVIDAPATLLDTGFAMATAEIAAMFPALPAATLGAPHLGPPHPHGHPPSFVPPAPPVPLPSIGAVAGAGCLSVLINGIPAARAGDIGLAITCGSVAPPIEVILGSSSVFIGGSRAARMTDVTRHCNPVGGSMSKLGKVLDVAGKAAAALGVVTSLMDANQSLNEAAAADSAAEAEAAAAAAAGQAMSAGVQAAQMAADAVAAAAAMAVGKDPAVPPILGLGVLMYGSPNVMIGGFPCPNLMEVAKGLLKAAKKLRRKPKKTEDAEGAGGAGCSTCKS